MLSKRVKSKNGNCQDLDDQLLVTVVAAVVASLVVELSLGWLTR